MTHTVAKSPCKSCPYRCDVPSGVWSATEYEKLMKFDGDMGDQFAKGGLGVFDCHQRDGHLCAGWLATHGATNLLAFRLTREEIAPEVWDYKSPVPVFKSGAEAAEHGIRDIDDPGVEANAMINRLYRKREREGW